MLSACKKRIKSDSTDEINFSFHEYNFGASADELLKDDRFTSLAVEVQYMKGFKPDARAIEILTFLRQHLHKPGGIYFYQKQIKPVQGTILSRKQVDGIRRSNRTIYTKKNQIAVYILYTNGRFENPYILGHAFRNTSIVIYGKVVKDNENVSSFPTQTTIESTLLLHEMGHLLGLVNKDSQMQADHADTAHEAHCMNPECFMYWSIPIKPQYGPVALKHLPSLDASCQNDLIENGGK